MHGNYLRAVASSTPGSTRTTCRESDQSKMNFGSGGSSKAKAWRDIWGAGQGVGAIKRVVPAAEMVARFADEYQAARHRLDLAAVPDRSEARPLAVTA